MITSYRSTLSATLAATLLAVAAPLAVAQVKLSQVPLAKAASQHVAPNLLFILDDSGSMQQQYTPDYVSERWDNGTAPNFRTDGGSTGDRHCRDSADDSGSGTDICLAGDPPYMSGQFNRQFYNPRVRYLPGTKADGSSYPSLTSAQTDGWTKVPTDAYEKMKFDQLEKSRDTIDITTESPDRAWCEDTGNNPKLNTSTLYSALDPAATCRVNGKSGVAYPYPNATYKYGRGTGGYDGSASGGTGTGNGGKIKYVFGAPYYYNIAPLYCTDTDATQCSKTKTGSYLTEVPFRWCKVSNSVGVWNDCQDRKTSTYYMPSFLEPETALFASGSFKVGTDGNNKGLTLTVQNGATTYTLLNTFNSKNSGNNTKPLVAAKIRDAINGTLAVGSGTCNGVVCPAAPDYAATCKDSTCSDSIVTITAKATGSNFNGSIQNSGNITLNDKSGPSGGADGTSFFTRVDIVPATAKYQTDGGKPQGRTDCVTYADGCSYDEEMTNYANWFAYYRIRMLMLKSAASTAFKDIDNSFRVGYTQINKLKDAYVDIKAFDSGQRTSWYTKLLGASDNGSTPLRGALAFAGQVYAGQKPEGISDDPAQYSCQQNFTLLTTDGYWNESGTPEQIDGTTEIGNQDGGTTPRPYYEGSTAVSNSLADVAMYYYNTDLRTTDLGNCTSSLTSADVCEDNVPVSSGDQNNKQHMVTYTLGLGVDGQLKYRSDYKTATSGDFHKIKNGLLDWPKPANNTETAVDDLWHAAVNGRGQYFSAQDPVSLVSNLKAALTTIAEEYGSGAAAATSTTEPVSGDNFAYIATYTTGEWTGNLEARLIDTVTGNVGLQAQWCAEDIPANPTLSLTACTGTMAAKVAAASDTRTIYFNSSDTLTSFTPANLSAHLGKFDVTKLSQYPGWSADYKAAADSEKLINYLRGQWGFDGRDTNTTRLFRQRNKVLGDFVSSPPKFVCKASATYTDPGYAAFSSSLVNSSTGACDRTPMIYIGSNDGMLHAFNATTGAEAWTFVPTPVLAQMWRLADTTYASNHRFLVDGNVTVGDVCTANCDSDSATWKTVLVGALGAGVCDGDDPDTCLPSSGYFAIDVTDPATPTLLWEVTSATTTLGDNIGYTLGKPWLGKVQNSSGGTVWAVMLSSGITPAAGKASLTLLNAYTGDTIRTITVDGAGDITRFSPQFVKPGIDQTTQRIYAGDLSGNVWRIGPNDSSSSKVFAGGLAFTTAPELSICNGKTLVYIGSGKFLESGDLTDQTQQSIFGFVDDYETNGTIDDPAAQLQALTVSSGVISGTTSTGSNKGWFLALPDIPAGGGAERIALVEPVLQGNVLTFASNIPESGVCLASGRSQLYQLALKTCGVTSIFASVLSGKQESLGNSLVVGLTSIKVDGKIKLIVTGSDGKVKTTESGATPGQVPFSGNRVNWRELIRD